MKHNDRNIKKIIEQAKEHLDTISNSHTLRDRIEQAIKENTLQAYWDLQEDLTNGSDIQKRFTDYYKDDDAIAYTRELAAILRGERL